MNMLAPIKMKSGRCAFSYLASVLDNWSLGEEEFHPLPCMYDIFVIQPDRVYTYAYSIFSALPSRLSPS